MNALIETVEISGRPVAVVARLPDSRVGYALCNSRDRFNIGRGTEIALGRANKLGLQLMIERLYMMCKTAAHKHDPEWGMKAELTLQALKRL
jgi:hypothetical protein